MGVGYVRLLGGLVGMCRWFRGKWPGIRVRRGYKCVAADVAAQRRRARPKLRKIDADLVLKQRVIADLRRSRTPRQIAGRLRAEAGGDRLEPCQGSPTAQGASVSHEAIYTWIYAMPKKTLREHGVMLGSKTH